MLKPEDWKQEGYIFPKSEEDRCTDPNCFSHVFKYPASSDQLKVRKFLKETIMDIQAGLFKLFFLGAD